MATPIARFNAVPYQGIGADPFNLGVLAYHASGIKEVKFGVNGEFYGMTHDRRHNTRTGYGEYFIILRAEDYPSRETLEITAIVIANSGEALYLNQDPTRKNLLHGTARQVLFNETYKAPAQVILPPGEYRGDQLPLLQKTPNGWSCYKARESGTVTITSPIPSVNPDRTCFSGINFRAPGRVNDYHWVTGNSNQMIWFKDFLFTGPDRRSDIKQSHGFMLDMYTEGVIEKQKRGMGGLYHYSTVQRLLGDDAYSYCAMIVHCEAHDINRELAETPTAHADVLQVYNRTDTFRNSIVSGLEAFDLGPGVQGVFLGPGTYDYAMENLNIAADHHAFSLYEADNLLVINALVDGPSLVRAGSGVKLTDVLFQGCSFNGNPAPDRAVELGATVRGDALESLPEPEPTPVPEPEPEYATLKQYKELENYAYFLHKQIADMKEALTRAGQ